MRPKNPALAAQIGVRDDILHVSRKYSIRAVFEAEAEAGKELWRYIDKEKLAGKELVEQIRNLNPRDAALEILDALTTTSI
jgi:adenylate kinase family enzyme